MAFTRDVQELIKEHADGALAIAPGWNDVRLGDIATIKNGAAFKSKYFNSEGDGMPLLRIRDVLPGRTESYYSGPYEEDYLVEEGDLVIGMDGDFHCRLWPGPTALLNQRVCRVDFAPNTLQTDFTALVLPAYLKVINDATPSITVKHLSSKTVADLRLPCPPVEEQNEVVRLLRQEQQRAETIEVELEAVQKLEHRFRRAVVRDACTGRLTALNHSDNGRSAAFELPAHWISRRLTEICEEVTKTKPTEEPAKSFTYIDISAIDRDRLEIAEPKQMQGRGAPSRARQLVKTGDILFSTVRPNLRAIARVPPELDLAVASTGFCVLRAGEAVDPDFLFWSVLSDEFQVRVLAKARGVSYPAVRDKDIFEESISLPPVEEQQAIVEVLEAELERARSIRAAAETVSAQVDDVRRSTVHRAFAGDLSWRDEA